MKAKKGQRFGKLKVVECGKKVKLKSGVYEGVLCRCDCGKIKVVRLDYLKQGTKSCGCEKGGFSHRLSRHISYNTWVKIMDRCYNKNSSRFNYYGARGIKVSKSWHNVKNFIKDMGEKPGKAYSIDRIDNNKGYSKENCKWSTPLEQSINKRNNILFDHKGEIKTLKQISRDTGISYTTLWCRLKRGVDINNALKK